MIDLNPCANCENFFKCREIPNNYCQNKIAADRRLESERNLGICRDWHDRITAFGKVRNFMAEIVNSLDGRYVERIFGASVTDFGTELGYGTDIYYYTFFLHNTPMFTGLRLYVKADGFRYLQAAEDVLSEDDRLQIGFRIGMTDDRFIIEVPDKMILKGLEKNVWRAKKELNDRVRIYNDFKADMEERKEQG